MTRPTPKPHWVLVGLVAFCAVAVVGLIVAVLHFERRTRPPQRCPEAATAPVAIEPAPALGDAGYPCKGDGSCNGPALACVAPELFWGLPMMPGGPRCQPKGSR